LTGTHTLDDHPSPSNQHNDLAVHQRGKHATDAQRVFSASPGICPIRARNGLLVKKSASPLEVQPSTPTMATPHIVFDEVSVQLAGSGIMQESELQAFITRTQNDSNRLHEDGVRTQDGVVLLGEKLRPPSRGLINIHLSLVVVACPARACEHQPSSWQQDSAGISALPRGLTFGSLAEKVRLE